MTMPDIIDEIDRLHAEATPGPWQRDLDRKCGDYGIGAAVPEFDGEYAVLMQPNCHVTNHQANVGLTIALRNNWPALRDRLVAAERKASDVNDELKSVLADWNEVRSASGSKTNGGLVGHITELRRKAKAFDAVARGDVGIGCRPNSNDTMKRDWVAYQLTPPRRCSNDLLTAIERATREAQP